jgi:signal transduction histidine kinase
VMRQADDAVRACAGSVLSHGPVTVPGYGLVAVPGSGLVPGTAGSGACGVELVTASGQVLIPAASAAGNPAVPASGSWLAGHLGGPVTVPGAEGGGRWRVLITAVRYRAQRMLFVFGPDDLRYVISGRTGHGSGGMLIVMAALADTREVAVGYAAAAGAVLVLLAAAAFVVTRAILRPLRAAAGFTANAGQDAMMPASIRERLRASRAAEAAARRSAADMADHLAQTCLQLRRPASIVHGYAGYLRQQHNPQPASAGQMLHRVTGEITQMETLAEGLRMPSAGDPAGTDLPGGFPAGAPGIPRQPG